MNRHRFLYHIVLGISVLAGYGPAGQGEVEKQTAEIRPSAVAGTFYSGSTSQLRKSVRTFLDHVPETEPAGRIYAAVAPHAGYTFSGQVAAYTHKALSGVDFDTLVIIGHDAYRGAVAFLCPVDYFQTPLGKMPVDRDMVEKMLDFHPGIKADRFIHAREHTVEVHLPFLQTLNKQCSIVPVLFGNPSVENCRILVRAILSAAGDKRVCVLASTDMSHYPTYEAAKTIDASTLETLLSLDVDRLFAHLEKQERQEPVPNLRTAMCARGGVGTAILFAKARGADRVQILHYANSGDAPAGDKRSVVGYSSALMVKTGEAEAL